MVTSGSQVRKKKFKVWEPAVPCHGNLWFPRWGPSVPTFRNWKFFAMATRGSQQERAVACNGNLWFPGCEPCVPTSETRQFLAIVTCGSHVGSREFQPLGPSSSLPWTKRKHSGTGPLSKQSVFYRSIKQNHKIVKKLFSYHFKMHLFPAKNFFAGPAAERKHSATGPLSKTKGTVTGTENKTKQH